MCKFLKKPYPFNDNLQHNAQNIFFISLGILVFLIIFQPIEIKDFSTRRLVLLGTSLAVSTFLVLSLNLIVFPSLFPKLFLNSKWNIGREIIWDVWILSTILGSYFLFYSMFFDIINITLLDIGKIVLLGLIPIGIIITINQKRLLRLNLKSAQLLNEKLIENKQEKIIHFESEYKKDELMIKPSSLIMIMAADNYIEVYYEYEGKIKNQMIRSSLTKAEKTISEYYYILKCHRSFIVNINYIAEVQGNSQGYTLNFTNIDIPAYVSQSFINEFKKRIQSIRP